MKHATDSRWIDAPMLTGLVALLAGVVSLVPIALASQPKPPEQEVAGPGAICGPQCVQRILRHFGMEESLVDLIREIQPTDVSEGSTLDVLQRALRKRGLHTAAMKIGPRVRIQWPHPVLVHLRRDDGEGHYVVQFPSSTQHEERFWLGPGGMQTVARGTVSARRSGALLLVSPEPISDPSEAFVVTSGSWWWAAVPISIVVLCFSLVPLVFHRRS